METSARDLSIGRNTRSQLPMSALNVTGVRFIIFVLLFVSVSIVDLSALNQVFATLPQVQFFPIIEVSDDSNLI